MALFNTIIGALTGGNGIGKTAKDLAGIFDKSEDKKEVIDKVFADKQDARINGDKMLQRIYGIVFLVAYIGLSIYFVWTLANYTIVSKELFAFISSAWTGTSTKVNTITDNLFGGSMSETINHLKTARQQRKDKE